MCVVGVGIKEEEKKILIKSNTFMIKIHNNLEIEGNILNARKASTTNAQLIAYLVVKD